MMVHSDILTGGGFKHGVYTVSTLDMIQFDVLRWQKKQDLVNVRKDLFF